MTFFLCGFKYFHGSLPDSPKQRLPQARTGKVRHFTHYTEPLSMAVKAQFLLPGTGKRAYRHRTRTGDG
jgi:hypothetical protein